jgi:hypothetical protein
MHIGVAEQSGQGTPISGELIYIGIVRIRVCVCISAGDGPRRAYTDQDFGIGAICVRFSTRYCTGSGRPINHFQTLTGKHRPEAAGHSGRAPEEDNTKRAQPGASGVHVNAARVCAIALAGAGAPWGVHDVRAGYDWLGGLHLIG